MRTCISTHVRMCKMLQCMHDSRGYWGREAHKIGAVSKGGGHRWRQGFIGLSTRQVWTALSTLRNRLSTVQDRAVGSGGCVLGASRAEVFDEAMPPGWLGAPCLLASSSYPQPRGALATCASAWRRSWNRNGRELLLPVVFVQGRAPFAARDRAAMNPTVVDDISHLPIPRHALQCHIPHTTPRTILPGRW